MPYTKIERGCEGQRTRALMLYTIHNLCHILIRTYHGRSPASARLPSEMMNWEFCAPTPLTLLAATFGRSFTSRSASNQKIWWEAILARYCQFLPSSLPASCSFYCCVNYCFQLLRWNLMFRYKYFSPGKWFPKFVFYMCNNLFMIILNVSGIVAV